MKARICHARTVGFISLGLALLFSLSFVFVGLGGIRDPYYWIERFPLYSISPMVAGSMWLGHIWTIVFGGTLLSIRLLAWLLSMASIVIPYLHFVKREQWLNKLPYLSVGLVLMGYCSYGEYSPGVTTVFFLVCVIVAFSKYLERQSFIYLLFSSLLSSCAVICRFPNIVCVPFCLFLIILCGISMRRSIGKICFDGIGYLLVSLLFYWILFLLFTKSANIASVVTSSVSGAAVATHSMSSLIGGLFSDYPLMLEYVSIWLFFGFLSVVFQSKATPLVKAVWSILLSLLFGLFIIKGVGFHKWYNFQFHYFVSALAIALLVCALVQSISKRNEIASLQLLLILLIGFVAPLGSDTKWMKLFPMFCCFIPVLLSHFYPIKSIFQVPLLVVVVFSAVLCYYGNPIGSVPMWKAVRRAHHDKLKCILVSESQNHMIENWSNDCSSYINTDNMAAYGDGSFFLTYLLGTNNKAIQTFDSDYNDEEFVRSNKDALKQSKPDLFVFKQNYSDCLFFDMLRELKYQIVKETNDYMILTMVNTMSDNE